MKVIDRNSIDKFARESFGLLANEEKNPTGNLFYREGFAAGFKRGQKFESESGFDSLLKMEPDPEKVKEFEKEWMEQSKHSVLVKVNKVHLHDAEMFLNQFSDEKCNPVADTARKLAQATERRIFEIMTECKAKKCYVVDFGPEYDGSTARWTSFITCDEKEAQFKANLHRCNYNEHDFTNLLEMTDKEFERLVTESVSRGDRNGDAVRKWRQTLKEVK